MLKKNNGFRVISDLNDEKKIYWMIKKLTLLD